MSRRDPAVSSQRIPTWSETVARVTEGDATPLDRFVYHNEPTGGDQELEWREQLQDMLDFVLGERDED